jgi:putative membrane protein insertion efficiency factor
VNDSRRGPAAAAALGLIALYQAARAGRPTGCRFHPSCSVYAEEAIASHGFARGGWLALKRLIRCNPLGSRGFDPVPEPAGATR